METSVPLVKPHQTIMEVEKMLVEKVKDFETINYIYVLDDAQKLVGAISVREVFRVPKNTFVKDVMEKDLVTIHPQAHQESAAKLAIKHNLKSIPVVDTDGKFLGIVPSDTILNILHEEHIEDFLHSAGIHRTKNPVQELENASAFSSFKKRLPWLVFGLLGGILAAFVLNSFDHIFSEMIALAAFIPAVVYMADAVGSQTQTVFIRSLALDSGLDVRKYIWREIRIGIILAFVFGIIMTVIPSFWASQNLLGPILGISFFATIMIAVVVAVFLPWLFYKLKFDPAVASGPFATAVRDIISVASYVSIASVILT